MSEPTNTDELDQLLIDIGFTDQFDIDHEEPGYMKAKAKLRERDERVAREARIHGQMTMLARVMTNEGTDHYVMTSKALVEAPASNFEISKIETPDGNYQYTLKPNSEESEDESRT